MKDHTESEYKEIIKAANNFFVTECKNKVGKEIEDYFDGLSTGMEMISNIISIIDNSRLF